jgi:hypothetical protein
MSEDTEDYCRNIFNSIMKECNKRGEGSNECVLFKYIFNRKCTNKKDCIKIRDLLLETCYNTKTSESYINKECIYITKRWYDKC